MTWHFFLLKIKVLSGSQLLAKTACPGKLWKTHFLRNTINFSRIPKTVHFQTRISQEPLELRKIWFYTKFCKKKLVGSFSPSRLLHHENWGQSWAISGPKMPKIHFLRKFSMDIYHFLFFSQSTSLMWTPNENRMSKKFFKNFSEFFSIFFSKNLKLPMFW